MSTMSMKYSVAACAVWLTTAAVLLITETGCLHEQGDWANTFDNNYIHN